MAAYYKVEVSLGTNAVEVGIPSPQSVNVVLPLVGPAGPQGAAGAAGATGAQGPQGVPGTGLEVLTTQGDLLYQGAATGERLPIGAEDEVLKVESGVPVWGAAGEAYDQSLNTSDNVLFQNIETDQDVTVGGDLNIGNALNVGGSGIFFEEGGDSATRDNLGLGDSATANIGTGAGDVCAGDDARLSDARTPLSHTHGNLTNDGKVGTTANLPLKTGTNGVVEAGSFGTAAASFCEGNDARLSDARTPSSTLAHKASHATGGTDALAPSDIGAQSIFLTEDLGTITANVTLTAARAKIYTVTVNTFDTPTPSVQLPTTDIMAGDVVQIRFSSNTGREMTVRDGDGFLGSNIKNGQRVTYIAASTSNTSWSEDGTNRHTHAATDITSGTLDVARLPVGTGSTQVAAGNHTHVVADVTGAAASGSITSSGLTQATARILGRTTASTGAVEEIQIGSGLSLSAGELSATGGGGSSIMQAIAVGFVLN
jgi:hypothetical protein